MRHVVLGAGGVGGIIAAVLARSGTAVLVIVLNPHHPPTIHVESKVLGTFEAPVEVATSLDREVDVLWVTVKATQLEAALESAPARFVKGTVIPLLNGIDHVEALREVYPVVTPGALGGECERVAPGRIVEPSGVLWVQLAGPFADAACAELKAGGLNCSIRDDERLVLWQKLTMLVPLALSTTAEEAPLGAIRDDPRKWARLEACIDEIAAVANAQGIPVDAGAPKQGLSGLTPSFRTSMQKDRAAGRRLELDHLVRPILREGRLHGVPTPAIEALADQVRAFA